MSIKNRTARLPRAGVIRLGTPKTASSPGRNLDHFRIDTAAFPPEMIAQSVGHEPKELRIKFPNVNREDPERSASFIFDASYKAYKNGSLFCKGDGETAVRAIAKNKIETIQCPCEHLTGKNQICKQRAELRVILCDLPFMGYFQIGTSSWNSINSIQGMIDMYRNLLGDNFWTTEFILYKEAAMMQGHRQYLLRLKIAPEFVSTLPIGSAVTASMVFEDDADDEPDETPPEPSESSENKKQEPQDQAVKSDAPEPPPSPSAPTASVDQEPPARSVGELKKPEDAKSADAPPESSDTATQAPLQEDPSASVKTASPSRAITPQRRSKEAHLRNALRKFGPYMPEKTDDINKILYEFVDGMTIEEIPDKDISSILNVVNEAIRMAENGEKQQKLIAKEEGKQQGFVDFDSEDIPF